MEFIHSYKKNSKVLAHMLLSVRDTAMNKLGGVFALFGVYLKERVNEQTTHRKGDFRVMDATKKMRKPMRWK